MLSPALLITLLTLLLSNPAASNREQAGDPTVLLQRAVHVGLTRDADEAAEVPRVSKETTWSCVGTGLARTCRFKNLYYGRTGPDGRGAAEFQIFTTKQQQEELDVCRRNKYDPTWQPQWNHFDSLADLEGHVASKRLLKQDKLAVHFLPVYAANIGHALFDGLYPAYLALTKFGLQEEVFQCVAGVDEVCFEDDKEGPLTKGDVVEAYLPASGEEAGHKLQPEHVQIMEMPAAGSGRLCDFHSGQDSGGLDLEKRVVDGDDDQRRDACCRACALTMNCTTAVLDEEGCYLKGACPDGTASCTDAKANRTACTPKPGAAQGSYLVAPLSHGNASTARHQVPEAWVLGRVRTRCMSEEVYETFGGAGPILRLFEMERDAMASPNFLLHFKDIVIGVGGAGNMVQDPTGAIAGGPTGEMAAFRDRMYQAYGLEAEQAALAKQSPNKVDVMFVANKRYSAEDEEMLRGIINESNGSTVNCEYVNWQAMGGEPRFKSHLQRVMQADVYVSAPGTALQYVPFLRDGRVYVALGTIWQHLDRVFPTFMEQQLAGGGTPYLRTLYADPGAAVRDGWTSPPNVSEEVESLQFAAVSGSQVRTLLHHAVALIRSGFRIPVPIADNLSPEGQVLLELCHRDPDSCEDMNTARNVGPDFACEWWVWGEAIVYEAGPWAPSGACPVNHKLIRELRRKYKLPGYGAPEI